MSKLLLLYLTFVVGLVFLILPDPISTKDFFPLYDIQLYLSTYVYFILEKCVVITLAGIIYNEATEYRQELKIFMWILIADLADYLLTYNTPWLRIGNFPVSMNTTKSFIFGLTILNAWIKNLLK